MIRLSKADRDTIVQALVEACMYRAELMGHQTEDAHRTEREISERWVEGFEALRLRILEGKPGGQS